MFTLSKIFAFKKILGLGLTLLTLSSSLLYCSSRPICENLSHLHAQYAKQSVDALHVNNDNANNNANNHINNYNINNDNNDHHNSNHNNDNNGTKNNINN